MTLSRMDETLDVKPGTDPSSEPPVQADVKPASEPSAEAATGVKPQSQLDIVAAALKAQREPAAPEEKTESPSAEGEEAHTAPDLKADDDADPKPGSKEFNFRALEARVKEYGDKAKRFDTLHGFLQESRLTQDEFAAGLELLRLLKNDPAGAHKALTPIVQNLSRVLGEVIPQDLQDKIDRGLIDEETARELSRARSERNIAATRMREIETMTQQERDQRAAQEMARSNGTAVSNWEKAWRESDPDYERKSPFVRQAVVALMQEEGYPATAEAAVDQARRAKEKVDGMLKGFLPKQRPMTTVTGGVSSETKPQPKTPLDVVRMALNG